MKQVAKLCLGFVFMFCVSEARADVTVVIREAQRTLTLAPGEIGNLASACLQQEAVVGGGPTTIPASLAIELSTLFFDGQRSGWQVDFRNVGAETSTVTPAVAALCMRGRMIVGTPGSNTPSPTR